MTTACNWWDVCNCPVNGKLACQEDVVEPRTLNESVRQRCGHCGAWITFSANMRKWVTIRETKRGTKMNWHCGNDPAFPVRAHHPVEQSA